jgi:Beta protein
MSPRVGGTPRFKLNGIGSKSKAGEATALQNLTPQAKARMLPLVQLVAEPPATFCESIGAAWAGLPLALDGLFNFEITGSATAFTGMIADLGRRRVRVIPSVECEAPAACVAATRRFVGRFAPGLLVRASLRQLPNVAAWVAAQNWQPNVIDLVITAGHAAAYDPAMFDAFVLHAIQQHLRNATAWRSVTLASSAAPQDHSALALGRNNVPRLDWRLWRSVSPQAGFPLDYGDYGTLYPDLAEPPGLAMTRATVSVRYTVADNWIILLTGL